MDKHIYSQGKHRHAGKNGSIIVKEANRWRKTLTVFVVCTVTRTVQWVQLYSVHCVQPYCTAVCRTVSMAVYQSVCWGLLRGKVPFLGFWNSQESLILQLGKQWNDNWCRSIIVLNLLYSYVSEWLQNLPAGGNKNIELRIQWYSMWTNCKCKIVTT